MPPKFYKTITPTFLTKDVIGLYKRFRRNTFRALKYIDLKVQQISLISQKHMVINENKETLKIDTILLKECTTKIKNLKENFQTLIITYQENYNSYLEDEELKLHLQKVTWPQTQVMPEIHLVNSLQDDLLAIFLLLDRLYGWHNFYKLARVDDAIFTNNIKLRNQVINLCAHILAYAHKLQITNKTM